jgi:beta-lactam-binding protein with PASTA domain
MTGRPLHARRWLPYTIAATAGFLVAFLAMAALLSPSNAGPSEVITPSVVGLGFPDAERRLSAAGLRAMSGQQRPSPDVPANTVVGQNPLAGERVGRGTEVVLDVSEGDTRVVIPPVVGRSRDDAERALREVGLELGDVSEQDADSARGTVLSLSPAAGVTVPRGTRINATLSAGPGELLLPDVVGRDLAGARGLLEQLGLQLAPLAYDSVSTLRAGTVIAQTPAAGAQVARGSVITLRVSGRP